ncbi:phosphopantetheine-binding protein [Streptomyces sp. NPDC048506]|uniref:phosphopantetheine-binding protein n=1 Tax=Streptomyces sp. NPDC048506 TaxID=3155028 RepID=UPI0034351CD4
MTDAETHRDDLVRTVQDVVGRLMPPGRVSAPPDPGAPLADLGFDSLRTVSLLTELEKSLSVEFPADRITAATFHSVHAIVDAVAALVPDGEVIGDDD